MISDIVWSFEQKRLANRWRKVKKDCFNPYTDYNNDLFGYTSLFKDELPKKGIRNITVNIKHRWKGQIEYL